MMETSDEQILELIQSQSEWEKGFRLLTAKYQERLYWQIRRIVLNHEDANDVIQNTFIKVYRNISKFEAKSKLYTWLYRIATNEAITFLRKKKRKETVDIDGGDGAEVSRQLKADVYFDGDEIQVQLQAALATLPEKQKAVFNLRYFDELSYAEISELLDTSVGALKASYHHAVKKIEGFIKAKQL
ncbi:MAG: sigma-70 family RNA polymerase sigma factor [Bacteroidota bacterium]